MPSCAMRSQRGYNYLAITTLKQRSCSIMLLKLHCLCSFLFQQSFNFQKYFTQFQNSMLVPIKKICWHQNLPKLLYLIRCLSIELLFCLLISHGKKSYTALNQNVYLIFRLGGPGVNELGMMLHHLSDQTWRGKKCIKKYRLPKNQLTFT